MEKLKEGYEVLNPDADIQIQLSDSTTGITSVINGTADIGMSSRELKAEEAEKVQEVQIATDGIAVIVNPENSLDNITKEQVKNIFDGTDTDWNSVK
jgi:phosphate transport system substrate-binding protein